MLALCGQARIHEKGSPREARYGLRRRPGRTRVDCLPAMRPRRGAAGMVSATSPKVSRVIACAPKNQRVLIEGIILASTKWPWLGSTALTAGGITHRNGASLNGPLRTGNPFLRACEALPFRSDSRGCSATRESIFLTSPHQNRRACYNPGCYLLEESSWLNSIPKASYFG